MTIIRSFGACLYFVNCLKLICRLSQGFKIIFWNFWNPWSAHSFKIVHNNWVKSKFLEGQEDRVFHVIVQSVHIFFESKISNIENLKRPFSWIIEEFLGFSVKKITETVKISKIFEKSTWEIKLIFRILSIETGILFTCSHVKNFDSKNSQFKSEIFRFLSLNKR